MESVGDEKRIQALFSELSVGDKTRAPHFEKLWLRAEASAGTPALVIMRWVPVTVAIVVLAAVCLLVASAWFTSSQSQNAANIPPQTIPTVPVPGIRQSEKLPSVADAKSFRTERRRRVARSRHPERLAANEVAKLSTWHSPTNIFLQSPTASALSSLPQLDRSVRDLQTFLPKNNEMIKELK